MPTCFETLYDLAIEIQINPQYQELTCHSSEIEQVDVESRLRRSILELAVPAEYAHTRWYKTRILCLNLLNRTNVGVRRQEVENLLHFIEAEYKNDQIRVEMLTSLAGNFITGSGKDKYINALCGFAIPRLHPELGNNTVLDWLDEKWLYWFGRAERPVQELDADELLRDIDALCVNRATKVNGLTLASTANFFGDMGLRAFGSPGKHVAPVINMLQLKKGERSAFRGLVKIAQVENERLFHNRRFGWLQDCGGLYPRYLERIIYMIGSDDYNLVGTKSERAAPLRHKLMRDALIEAGLLHASYAEL